MSAGIDAFARVCVVGVAQQAVCENEAKHRFVLVQRKHKEKIRTRVNTLLLNHSPGNIV